METEVLGVKPPKPFKNSFLEITERREQPPYYIDFNFLASTRRRIQPLDLQDKTWRKLPLPSFLASTRRRLRPPFLAPSCHPDKKIEIAEPQPHWSCGPIIQHLCYTTQSVPYRTTCTTLHNLYHAALPLPLLATAHYLITTHQPITVHCITILINMYNQPVPIIYFSHQPTQSI